MTDVEKKVEELRKKHGVKDVHVIDIENDNGEPFRAYLKSPDRAVLSRSISLAQTDPIRANEIVLNSCWLDGDEIIKTDDTLFMSAMQVLGGLINIRKATLNSFR